MKRTNLQRKIKNLNLLSFSTLILTVILFVSCNITTQQVPASEETTSVSFISVLPEEYSNKYSAARSAIPAFSDATLLYKVTASYTENNETVTITRTDCTKEFSLPLLPEKIYTVKVDAYDRSDSTKTPLFTGTKEEISVRSNITEGNGPFTVQLKLYKDENGNIKAGTGSVKLELIADYNDIRNGGHQGLIYSYTFSGNDITPITSGSGVQQGTFAADKNTISISDVPANANPYNLLITFLCGSSEIVYQFHTDVMVFAGAETNTWKNEIELGSGENANRIVITQAFVDAYTSKYFYVKNDSSISENGQGTYTTPWRSIQSAIDKIIDINDGSSKYTVYLLGELTGSYNLNSSNGVNTYYPGRISLTIPDTNTKDLKLCIQGINPTQLDSDNDSVSEISIINGSDKNIFCELVNLECEHSIQAENAEIKMTVLSAPQITVTDCTTTIIGVTTDQFTVSGTASTVQIGGLASAPNNIALLSLPNNASGSQIKLKVMNQNSDNSPLTLNGSSIGIRTATKPTSESPILQFTEAFATATNTTASASEIFISNEQSPNTPFAVGVLNSGTNAGEACLGLSQVSINSQGITPLSIQFCQSNNGAVGPEITDTINISNNAATELFVKAFAENGSDTLTDVTTSSSVSWAFEVSLYGTVLSQSELNRVGISFTEPTSTVPAKITFNQGINSGLYQIFINPTYTTTDSAYTSSFYFDVVIE